MRAIISIIGDDRKKPQKFFRIEAELQPLMKNGELILNEAERANPHMQRLEGQFLSASPNSKTMDGPDFVEGGVWFIKNKLSIAIAGVKAMIKQFSRPVNKKRF
ncbi:hypothetical protein LWM68_40890 [Niabella sp. W65]|nr:hypothetical protein [Niabella sp. W65]MCH7368530.1 hypothetical protein [Niabella sp. W65]ULT44121.1 hypothetical protein KRR40_12595 [Niabella sp. I65]